MKIRQARKIMRQQPENDHTHHKRSAYWIGSGCYTISRCLHSAILKDGVTIG